MRTQSLTIYTEDEWLSENSYFLLRWHSAWTLEYVDSSRTASCQQRSRKVSSFYGFPMYHFPAVMNTHWNPEKGHFFFSTSFPPPWWKKYCGPKREATFSHNCFSLVRQKTVLSIFLPIFPTGLDQVEFPNPLLWVWVSASLASACITKAVPHCTHFDPEGRAEQNIAFAYRTAWCAIVSPCWILHQCEPCSQTDKNIIHTELNWTFTGHVMRGFISQESSSVLFLLFDNFFVHV
jgi:hypothetical protein